MRKSWDSYCSEITNCPHLNQFQGMCYIDRLWYDSYAPINKLGIVSQMYFIDWKLSSYILEQKVGMLVGIRCRKWILKRSQKAQTPNSAYKISDQGRQLWLLKHSSRSRRETVSGRKELWWQDKPPLNLSGLGRGWEERKKTFISCLDNTSCGSGKFFRAVIYHEVSQITGDIDLIETPFQYMLSQQGGRAWSCQFKALFNQH